MRGSGRAPPRSNAHPNNPGAPRTARIARAGESDAGEEQRVGHALGHDHDIRHPRRTASNRTLECHSGACLDRRDLRLDEMASELDDVPGARGGGRDLEERPFPAVDPDAAIARLVRRQVPPVEGRVEHHDDARDALVGGR